MAIIEEFRDQEFRIEEEDLLIVGLPNMSEIYHCFQTFWRSHS